MEDGSVRTRRHGSDLDTLGRVRPPLHQEGLAGVQRSRGRLGEAWMRFLVQENRFAAKNERCLDAVLSLAFDLLPNPIDEAGAGARAEEGQGTMHRHVQPFRTGGFGSRKRSQFPGRVLSRLLRKVQAIGGRIGRPYDVGQKEREGQLVWNPARMHLPHEQRRVLARLNQRGDGRVHEDAGGFGVLQLLVRLQQDALPLLHRRGCFRNGFRQMSHQVDRPRSDEPGDRVSAPAIALDLGSSEEQKLEKVLPGAGIQELVPVLLQKASKEIVSGRLGSHGRVEVQIRQAIGQPVCPTRLPPFPFHAFQYHQDRFVDVPRTGLGGAGLERPWWDPRMDIGSAQDHGGPDDRPMQGRGLVGGALAVLGGGSFPFLPCPQESLAAVRLVVKQHPAQQQGDGIRPLVVVVVVRTLARSLVPVFLPGLRGPFEVRVLDLGPVHPRHASDPDGGAVYGQRAAVFHACGAGSMQDPQGWHAFRGQDVVSAATDHPVHGPDEDLCGDGDVGRELRGQLDQVQVHLEADVFRDGFAQLQSGSERVWFSFHHVGAALDAESAQLRPPRIVHGVFSIQVDLGGFERVFEGHVVHLRRSFLPFSVGSASLGLEPPEHRFDGFASYAYESVVLGLHGALERGDGHSRGHGRAFRPGLVVSWRPFPPVRFRVRILEPSLPCVHVGLEHVHDPFVLPFLLFPSHLSVSFFHACDG
eukprot:scaffold208_cov323-Pavlova_lutheri.AAC.11